MRAMAASTVGMERGVAHKRIRLKTKSMASLSRILSWFTSLLLRSRVESESAGARESSRTAAGIGDCDYDSDYGNVWMMVEFRTPERNQPQYRFYMHEHTMENFVPSHQVQVQVPCQVQAQSAACTQAQEHAQCTGV